MKAVEGGGGGKPFKGLSQTLFLLSCAIQQQQKELRNNISVGYIAPKKIDKVEQREDKLGTVSKYIYKG